MVREGRVAKLGHEELVRDFNSVSLWACQGGRLCHIIPAEQLLRKEVAQRAADGHLVHSGLTGVPELAVYKCTSDPLDTRNGSSLCFLLLYQQPKDR